MSPVKIKAEGNKYLYIKWDDNSEQRIKLSNLRTNCPCAICTTERNGKSSNYFPIYSNDELSIKKINLVGSYGMSIEWKDHHNTGIYEFNFIKKL
ncbi:MAG: DUF971 domain-containing protein [Ignavibacteria bacterium]|nr:DUF971 domain-containing protein [Ignavibacteria bacterium]